MIKPFISIALFLMGAILLSGCSNPDQPQIPLSKNATVVVSLLDQSVVQGGIIHYNVTITRIGTDKKFDAALEHRIFSTPLGRVVKTQGEIVHLEDSVHMEKAISLPSDAPTGNYQLMVGIRFGLNGSAESGGFFDVVPKIEEVVEGKSPPIPSSQELENGSLASPDEVLTTPSVIVSSSSSPTGRATQASSPTPSPPREVVIEHKGRLFVPNKVTVDPGTIVVWINRDQTSAVVDGSGFHSAPLGINKEFRHTFKKIGIFDFFSSLTKAEGTVIVEDPNDPIVRKRDPMSFKGSLNS